MKLQLFKKTSMLNNKDFFLAFFILSDVVFIMLIVFIILIVFIMIINVKMPTIVGILTFMSMINIMFS